ncbi:MAG TPA: hypothetical protein VKR57_05210 [Terriglobales bacterium]|nr:hypothetical protein [Terriglobales bacterium]
MSQETIKVDRRVARYFVLIAGLGLFLSLAGERSHAQTAPCSPGTGVCVLTWQQDTGLDTTCSECIYRTGENLNEPTLTSGALEKQNFGVLCSAPLDGQVFGQPLVATNVTINNVTYSRVVYVVTQKDTLYAIDGNPADNPPCQILNGNGNGVSLLGSGQYQVDCNHVGGGRNACINTIGPFVGVLGTPVINLSGNSGTIYFVAETQDCDPQDPNCTPENWGHYLHAVDIQTFVDQNVQIYPPGLQNTASSFSHAHIQRPGLLYLTASQSGLAQDTVYVAFSMMDGAGLPYSNGTIFGYDPANLVQSATPFYFQTSDGINQNDGGGIWQAGGAPAFGSTGIGELIYFNTANGSVGNSLNVQTWDDSFLALNPDLTMPGVGTPYFTPVDQFFRSDASCSPPIGNDVDFGSGSVMLIPDNKLPNWPYLAVSGDKEGGLWFIDRSNPGGHNSQCDLPTPTCSCTPSGDNPSGNIQTVWTGTPYHGQTIHNGLAYWQRRFPGSLTTSSYLYVIPSLGVLTQYQLCNAASATEPVCTTTVLRQNNTKLGYGATPTISAASSNASSAVVWASIPNSNAQPVGCASSNPQPGCGGTLEAFDAVSLVRLYTNHKCLNRDVLSPTSKFSVPTVANGNVYLGTHSVDSNGKASVGGMFYIFGLNAAKCS